MRWTKSLAIVLFLLGGVATARAEAGAATEIVPPPSAASAPEKAPAELPLAVPAQSPYRGPPEPASAELPGVPPYPGAAPGGFLSASAFADYGDWRLQQLSARERALVILGRPQGYRARRAGGFVMIGVGAGIAVLMGLFELVSISADTGSGSPSSRVQLGFLGSALGGLGLVIGGIVLVSKTRYENPYQQEIRSLHEERVLWKVDVKRARQQQKLQGLSFDPTRLLVRF
ncbi:MAG: hypothetical protein JWN04_2767 [Myxococcaceae bacterium]|nr:hypothetical protein [Myxococcaceae bacterium]